MDQWIWSFVLLVLPNGGEAEVIVNIDDMTYQQCMYAMGYAMGQTFDPETMEVVDELGFDDNGDVLITIREISSGDMGQATCMGFERDLEDINWSKS